MCSEDFCRERIRFGDFEVGGSIRAESGKYTEETLYIFRSSLYLRGKYGEKSPKWMFWRQNNNWRIVYKPLSLDEAKEWAQKHLN